MTKEYPDLYKVKGDLYRPIKTDLWYALEQVKVPELTKVLYQWLGLKIPIAKARQVLRFIKWSYDETKSETVVHGYYHPVHGWEFLVLPQEGGKGMTIKTVENDPGRAAAERTLPGTWDGVSAWNDSYNDSGDWKIYCTWHHHCASGAFQSSTDEHDEKKKEGLHITSGKIDEKRFDIHARTSYGGTIAEARFSDWFDVPKAALELVGATDEEGKENFIKYLLNSPPGEDVTFPDWWKENVRRQAPTAVTHSSGYQNNYNNHHVGSQSGNQWQGNQSLPFQGQTPQRSPSTMSERERTEELEKGIRKISSQNKVTLCSVIEAIENLSEHENFWIYDVNRLLVKLDLYPYTATQKLKELYAKLSKGTSGRSIANGLSGQSTVVGASSPDINGYTKVTEKDGTVVYTRTEEVEKTAEPATGCTEISLSGI